MENRLYAFDWKYIGDMELGRPNPVSYTPLDVYKRQPESSAGI